MIYDGKLDNAMSLLKWLTDLENLKIDGRIEEVMTWDGKACKAEFNFIFFLSDLNENALKEETKEESKKIKMEYNFISEWGDTEKGTEMKNNHK